MEANFTDASKTNETPTEISSCRAEPREENSRIPVVLFDLLNKHRFQLKRSRRGESHEQSQITSCASSRQVLSSESFSRVAKMKTLKESQTIDNDFEDIQLGLNLTRAAEKVSNREFDEAEKILGSCQHLSVSSATPVQKVVHYFAKALQERIDIEKGNIDLEINTVHAELLPDSPQPDKVAYEVELPCSQITGFVATQAIMESVGSAARIHIIDFTVRSGSHLPILMHAIANRENCPLELLKITAIGAFEDMLEETGRWLKSFAESINLPFSFKAVLSDLVGFKTDLLELEDGEVVAMYLNLRLWKLLAQPGYVEAFVGAIKSLNPCLMVVAEVEVSTNTSRFLPRFYEALFYCSAVFDCFETVLQPNSQFRKIVEEVSFQNGIRDTVLNDGEERIHRQEKLDFWRALFTSLGLVEVGLSYSSLYLASLVVKWCSCWSSCTTTMNGKSIIIRWKGTPIKSLSAWKFKSDRKVV